MPLRGQALHKPRGRKPRRTALLFGEAKPLWGLDGARAYEKARSARMNSGGLCVDGWSRQRRIGCGHDVSPVKRVPAA